MEDAWSTRKVASTAQTRNGGHRAGRRQQETRTRASSKHGESTKNAPRRVVRGGWDSARAAECRRSYTRELVMIRSPMDGDAFVDDPQ